ncbi:MAG: Na+/H+ antiporter NhaC family protein [Planctomycetota bacterium]|nr:Na+/H+ antiporter NhaC family protein [Planctomycetota bacterium]
MTWVVPILMPLILAVGSAEGEEISFRLTSPTVLLAGVRVGDATIEAVGPDGEILATFQETVTIQGIDTDPRGQPLAFIDGVLSLSDVHFTASTVTIRWDGSEASFTVRRILAILVLLPPLLAIGLAIATREVLLSLFAGIWLGATLIARYNPVAGFLASLDHYMVQALADPDHAAIVLFTLSLSGMVGLMARSGGTRGLAEVFGRYARTVRSGQISTFLFGLVIFFDDYANTLLVGNTLRPLTDKLKISREKLAYIVDSTAAPVAGIAFISTWVGFEVGVIRDALESIDPVAGTPFGILIETIPYRFYSILAILFVLFIAWSRRDFGPMLRAERRAREEGKVLSDTAVPLLDRSVTDLESAPGVAPRAANAALPIVSVILATLVGLAWTGRSGWTPGANFFDNIRGVVESSDSYKVLFWGAAIGSVLAGVLAMGTRSLNLKDTIAAWMMGVRAMILAIAILILAWSIGSVCEDLQIGAYVGDLTRGWLGPTLLPAVIFLAAAGISFATGTSYGTMGILMPIAVPLAASIGGADRELLLASIGSVLAGAIFGDHCSPISDTTVLSSVASGSDHIDHVRTQAPYALVVAGASVLLGCIPVGLGFSPWIGLGLGAGALLAFLLLFGRRV